MDPTCATGCLDEELILPDFLQDDCVPEVNFGEISEIFLGIPGNYFTSVTAGAEWTARLAATGATKLIRVLVRGDRPRSTAAEPLTLSGGRKKSVPRDFVINFSIDDVNPTNHEAIRQIQCGGNFQAWYRTLDGKYVFGGNKGVKAFIDADLVIPRSSSEAMSYDGVLSWKGQFMEEMNIYPLA